MGNFRLPGKLPTYRHLLHAQYTRDGKRLLRDVIGLSRAFVDEGTVHDNWNGGTFGHDVQLFLPIEELARIDINSINDVKRNIEEDLKKLSDGVENEFFANVHLELYDENEENCQHAKPLRSRQVIDADTLSIWQPEMIRLFISHRDAYKVQANHLARTLESYGISCFVAHDSIEPMSIWQAEIIKGLETMEVMLAFVTNDFHKSIWTNQEIGYALGRDVPIIPLKVQSNDPEGFIGVQQALKVSLDNVTEIAPEIYNLVSDKLSNSRKLQSSLIRVFLKSPSFDDTKMRFDRLKKVVKKLTDSEVKDIINGFGKNDQLYRSFYLTNSRNRLCQFLFDTTGKEFAVEGKVISCTSDKEEDDIPF